MKSAPSATSSGMRGNEKASKRELDSVRIEKATNGFKVSTSTKAVGGTGNCCDYESPKESVFTDPEETITHVRKQLGMPDKPTAAKE